MRTQTQYNESKKLLRMLMQLPKEQKTTEVIAFAKTIAKNIAEYERRTFGFNTDNVTPRDILEFLMQQNGLSQSQLPEIGSQSLVSKILKGERELTRSHIAALCQRFNISPDTFF